MESDLGRSLTALGVTPYTGSAFDLRVDLNYCNIQRLPDDLFQLSKLQWLNLNFNKLQDLPNKTALLKNLKWLYLENNCFNKFPTVLCELKDLVRLFLSSNVIRSLPREIRQLTRLRLLDLSENDFSEFPLELCTDSLANLEKIFLDNNNFTSLPAQISALKRLKLLWLNDNKLEWLPQNICELGELEELQVKNNLLMNLPAYLTSKLSKLQKFEWKGCPLMESVRQALNNGIDGLRVVKDSIVKDSIDRSQLRSETLFNFFVNTKPIIEETTSMPMFLVIEYQHRISEQEDKVQFRNETGGGWKKPCYRMRTKPCGEAIIIDNFCSIEWPYSTNSSNATPTSGRRSGGSGDGTASPTEEENTDTLRNTLIKLGFNVRVMRGLMSLDIISALRFLSLEDHSYFDCVVVCILSHGTGSSVVGPDGISVDIKQLTDIFSSRNCPMLANKPKLFFVQMLEAEERNKCEKSISSLETATCSDTLTQKVLVPDDADFLLTIALIPKCAVSMRRQSVYHYYVGVLFGILEKFARKLHLLDVMTTVHSEIRRVRLSTDESTSVKITPHIQSTLKYNLYIYER